MSRENGMLDDMSEEELAAAQELQNSDAPIEQASADDPAPAEAGQEDAAQREAADSKPNPAADPDRPDGYVPKEAMQEARREARETRQKLDSIMEKLAEAATQKQVSAEAGQQDVAPDKDTDPIGYFEHENNQLRNELNQIKDTTGQLTEAQQQAQNTQQLVSTYQAHAAAFAQTTPDFQQAYQHVRDDRARYYAALGYSPERIGQQVNADELAIAQEALTEGVNPAERIYALAKVTGYTAPSATAQEDPNARLQAQAQMQEANKSLSQVSGANGVKDTKNADDFRNMSEAQLWDFISKNPGEAEKILSQVGT